jgi:hypothetical protein
MGVERKRRWSRGYFEPCLQLEDSARASVLAQVTAHAMVRVKGLAHGQARVWAKVLLRVMVT